jgi:integrase
MTRTTSRKSIRPFSVERHGGGWRARIRERGTGRLITVASGCESEREAEAAGWKYLNDITEGTWRDPHRGQMLLRTYIDKRWWPAQRLALNTKAQYRSLLTNHILPTFGDRPLATITSPEEVAAWEIALHEQPQPPGGKPLSVTSARHCRKLLALILSDTVTADLIARNAARIPRRRGMTASEARAAAAEAEQEPWTDPLQALLIAERAALLSGRDEEFVQVITMQYTGMRWGEMTGLEASCVKPGSIRIWWQLAEVNGVFVKIPPKYGSRRTIDIAPFLWDLISAHLRTTEGRKCSCDRSSGTPLCEGARHVFLGRAKGEPDGDNRKARRGVHQRRSGYAAWIFKPAAIGWYPQRSPRPARPVPVTAEPWPGLPVRGRNAHHRAQASWLPILPSATPHSCRHGRETCMDGHGVQKVLRDLVMGHRTAGMEGVYAHITPESRAALIAADEADWHSSLAARAAISARSPLGVLDALLAPFRDGQP